MRVELTKINTPESASVGEVPWDVIHERFICVAMDRDGAWYAYTQIPEFPTTGTRFSRPAQMPQENWEWAPLRAIKMPTYDDPTAFCLRMRPGHYPPITPQNKGNSNEP